MYLGGGSKWGHRLLMYLHCICSEVDSVPPPPNCDYFNGAFELLLLCPVVSKGVGLWEFYK